jgi:hypothetical protein
MRLYTGTGDIPAEGATAISKHTIFIGADVDTNDLPLLSVEVSPAACLPNPSSGKDCTIYFDATNSYTLGGKPIKTFDWIFGNGETAMDGKAIQHATYLNPGIVTVTLTATSQTGRVNSISIPLNLTYDPTAQGQ